MLLPLFNLSVSKEVWVLFSLLKKEGERKRRGKRKIFIPPFDIYIYIYIYIHTHTHTQPKSSFKVFKVQEMYEFHSKES
jgi:hypothetical protein